MADETKAGVICERWRKDSDALAEGVLIATELARDAGGAEIGFALVRGWNGIPMREECEQIAARIVVEHNAFEPMREAIREAAAWLWDPDENACTQFDRIAYEFYRATGYMRPGKDDPIPHSQEYELERNRAWERWRTERTRTVLANLRAALRAADGERRCAPGCRGIDLGAGNWSGCACPDGLLANDQPQPPDFKCDCPQHPGDDRP